MKAKTHTTLKRGSNTQMFRPLLAQMSKAGITFGDLVYLSIIVSLSTGRSNQKWEYRK